jgi:hypothetical protein
VSGSSTADHTTATVTVSGTDAASRSHAADFISLDLDLQEPFESQQECCDFAKRGCAQAKPQPSSRITATTLATNLCQKEFTTLSTYHVTAVGDKD